MWGVRVPREALKWGPLCGGKDQDSRDPHIPPDQLCPQPQVQKADGHIALAPPLRFPLRLPLLLPGFCRRLLHCQDPSPPTPPGSPTTQPLPPWPSRSRPAVTMGPHGPWKV